MAAKKKAGRRPIDLAELESSVQALGRKLSGAVPLEPGSIQIHLTDSGETCCVEGEGREVRMAAPGAAERPRVAIAGPSDVVQAILEGRMEASRAFIAGGIQVQGDLTYLEALLRDLGLLECNP